MKRVLTAVFLATFPLVGACQEGLELVGELHPRPSPPAPMAPPIQPPADPMAPPPETPTPNAPVRLCATTPMVIERILLPNCRVCHDPGGPSGLDLVSLGVRDRLRADRSRCGNRRLVFTRPTVGGHFFDKLDSDQDGCGRRMPFGGTALSTHDIGCLKEWLEYGPAIYPDPADLQPDGGAPVDAKPRFVCPPSADVPDKIIAFRCPGCHFARSAAGGLDLETRDLRARLLTARSKGCAPRPLVVLEPEVGGHFLHKLANDVPGCGRRMPLDRPPLPAEEIDCIKRWLKGEP